MPGRPEASFLTGPSPLRGVEVAGEKSGPRHGAVGRECDVVGHAFRGGYRDLRSAVVAIGFVECCPRDAAGEQAPGLVDPEPMHAVKRRAGDQWGDFIGLRRRRGPKGPVTATVAHSASLLVMDAISRSFFMDRVFVRSGGLANETYQNAIRKRGIRICVRAA